MKEYKALVEGRFSGDLKIITVNAESRKQAIQDIHDNDYIIKHHRCLESKYYDYVLENTNCESWDWKMAQYREEHQLPIDAEVDFMAIA